VTAKEILDVLVSVIPLFDLVICVLDSIFFGIATPTEASGIGALGAIPFDTINRNHSHVVPCIGDRLDYSVCLFSDIDSGCLTPMKIPARRT